MTTRLISILVAALVACGTTPRFSRRTVMWRDTADTTPFTPRPAKYESPQVWNTVDNTVFEPLVEVLAVRGTRRAVDVNAVDEVPDSSWFTNRIDTLVADPAAFARGPCTDPPPDPAGPWTVIGGKPDGANPGFLIQHASGAKFLFKVDTGVHGERASAADVIGSRIYYAAGYNAPCNEVAYLDPTTIALSPTATAEDFVGDKIPFTRAMLDAALARGQRGANGAVRGDLSHLLSGALGPWKDFGTRDDDPNDVVPHQDRRELRGSYIFGAWLGHYDAREQNSLDIWVETGGGAGSIRHYMLDFGDCLGSVSSWRRVTARRSHAYELDWSLALVELVTLGAVDRPWRDPRPLSPIWGSFDVEGLTPDRYRTAYRYGPYTQVTEADAAWGARILARMSPALIHAVIAEAKLEPTDAAELERILLGRRDKLLRRYLRRLSPLVRPRIDDDGRVCATDVRSDAETCVAIPSPRSDYQVIDLATAGTNQLRVHVASDADTYTIVGVDRD